jgi:hypothetical protein
MISNKRASFWVLGTFIFSLSFAGCDALGLRRSNSVHTPTDESSSAADPAAPVDVVGASSDDPKRPGDQSLLKGSNDISGDTTVIDDTIPIADNKDAFLVFPDQLGGQKVLGIEYTLEFENSSNQNQPTAAANEAIEEPASARDAEGDGEGEGRFYISLIDALRPKDLSWIDPEDKVIVHLIYHLQNGAELVKTLKLHARGPTPQILITALSPDGLSPADELAGFENARLVFLKEQYENPSPRNLSLFVLAAASQLSVTEQSGTLAYRQGTYSSGGFSMTASKDTYLGNFMSAPMPAAISQVGMIGFDGEKALPEVWYPIDANRPLNLALGAGEKVVLEWAVGKDPHSSCNPPRIDTGSWPNGTYPTATSLSGSAPHQVKVAAIQKNPPSLDEFNQLPAQLIRDKVSNAPHYSEMEGGQISFGSSSPVRYAVGCDGNWPGANTGIILNLY